MTILGGAWASGGLEWDRARPHHPARCVLVASLFEAQVEPRGLGSWSVQPLSGARSQEDAWSWRALQIFTRAYYARVREGTA